MTLFEIDAKIRAFLDNLYAAVDEDGVVEADFEQLEALQAEPVHSASNLALLQFKGRTKHLLNRM